MTGARALSLFTSLDHHKAGAVTRSDFLEFYAAMSQSVPTASPLIPTFAAPAAHFSDVHQSFSLQQSFGVRWSTIKAHAENAFQSFDNASNGSVDLKSFMAHFGFDEAGAPLPKDPTTSPTDAATLFSTYDTNGDGVISAHELATNSSSAATQNGDTTSIMAAWDTNTDGTISKQEFTDGFNLIKQATGIVSQYDLSGKGYFDQSDLQAAIDSNTANAAGPSAADLMAFWDANGDGKVTVPDVLAGLAQGGSVAQSEVPSVDPSSLDKLYAAYGYSAAPATPTAG